jgi:hypothetical protein
MSEEPYEVYDQGIVINKMVEEGVYKALVVGIDENDRICYKWIRTDELARAKPAFSRLGEFDPSDFQDR